MHDEDPVIGLDLEIEDPAELVPLPRLLPKGVPEELWRRLRPGDRVRLVEVPPEFLSGTEPAEGRTLAMYCHLVESGTVLTIQRVDPEDARPWTEVSWKREGGDREHHYLALNHGGISLVEGA